MRVGFEWKMELHGTAPLPRQRWMESPSQPHLRLGRQTPVRLRRRRRAVRAYTLKRGLRQMIPTTTDRAIRNSPALLNAQYCLDDQTPLTDPDDD